MYLQYFNTNLVITCSIMGRCMSINRIFFTARRYAMLSLCVRPFVCLPVRLSHTGIALNG